MAKLYLAIGDVSQTTGRNGWFYRFLFVIFLSSTGKPWLFSPRTVQQQQELLEGVKDQRWDENGMIGWEGPTLSLPVLRVPWAPLQSTWGPAGLGTN